MNVNTSAGGMGMVDKDYISYTVSAPSGRGTAMLSVDGRTNPPSFTLLSLSLTLSLSLSHLSLSLTLLYPSLLCLSSLSLPVSFCLSLLPIKNFECRYFLIMNYKS